MAQAVVFDVAEFSMLLLYFFKMIFNMLTLGGLAAAVGLIIDVAFVLVEHIPRRFHTDIGTLYLLRLAELASVAVARFFR